MTNLRVYKADVRNSELLFCPDMIIWFNKYGLDYEDFKRNGIDAEHMLTVTNNDCYALKAVEMAKSRRERGL